MKSSLQALDGLSVVQTGYMYPQLKKYSLALRLYGSVVIFIFACIRFELGSWSRLAKFPPTVAGEIGFAGLKMIILRRGHTS